MRDSQKICGLSIHQKPSTLNVSPELIQVLSSAGKGSSLKSLQGKLGVPCPEFSYKDIASDPVSGSGNSKKRKWNAHHPPTDYSNRIYLGVPDPSSPFALFIWYNRKTPDDPECVCVDVSVDGKKSPGWILWPGKHKGIVIDHILYRGRPTRFEFNSPLCTSKKTSAVNGSCTSDGSSAAKKKSSSVSAFGKPFVSGVIEVTFWRVMKLEREVSGSEYSSEEEESHVAHDSRGDSKNDDADDDENQGSSQHQAQGEKGVEYIPDEGLKALSVFTVYYRDLPWLLENSVIKVTSPLAVPLIKQSEIATQADANQLDSEDKTRKPLKSIENVDSPHPCSSSKPVDSVAPSPTASLVKPPKKRHVTKRHNEYSHYPSELSTVLSSPGINRLRQIDFSLLGSSSPVSEKNGVANTALSMPGLSLSSDMSNFFEVPDMIQSIRKDVAETSEQIQSKALDVDLNPLSVLANAAMSSSTSVAKRLRRERIPVYFVNKDFQLDSFSSDSFMPLEATILHAGRIQITENDSKSVISRRLEALLSCAPSRTNDNNPGKSSAAQNEVITPSIKSKRTSVLVRGCSSSIPFDSVTDMSHIESIYVGVSVV